MYLFIPRTRKGLIIFMSVLLAILLVATIATYLSWSADQQALKTNGQPDFNTLSEADLKDGLIVKGTIDMALDFYAEKSNNTNSTSSDSLYYIVPIYDVDESGSITFKYLITYKAEREDYEAMDEIVANSWNEQAGLKTLTIENAEIVALPSENKKFFTEWAEAPEIWGDSTFYDTCVESGIFGTNDRAVIESKFVPFMIDRTATAGTDLTIMWIFLGAVALCIILLVVLLLRKKPINGITDNIGDPDIMRPKQ